MGLSIRLMLRGRLGRPLLLGKSNGNSNGNCNINGNSNGNSNGNGNSNDEGNGKYKYRGLSATACGLRSR